MHDDPPKEMTYPSGLRVKKIGGAA